MERCKKCYAVTSNCWCRSCQLSDLANFYTSCTSRNERIDDFIRNKQLKINDSSDIIFEWIPYSQFSEIKGINKSSFVATFSAMWKDGPLYWDKSNVKDRKSVV